MGQDCVADLFNDSPLRAGTNDGIARTPPAAAECLGLPHIPPPSLKTEEFSAPLHFNVARRRFQLSHSPYATLAGGGGGSGRPGGRIGSPRTEYPATLSGGGGRGRPGGSIGSPRVEIDSANGETWIAGIGRQARKPMTMKQATKAFKKDFCIVVPFIFGC